MPKQKCRARSDCFCRVLHFKTIYASLLKFAGRTFFCPDFPRVEVYIILAKLFKPKKETGKFTSAKIKKKFHLSYIILRIEGKQHRSR